jgi:hypothetical protein
MRKRTLLETLLKTAPLLWIVLASAPVFGVTIDWVTVGLPGTAADSRTGDGAVAYTYRISKYEVTNAQYVEFLNAVAETDDPNGLYDTDMTTGSAGGITRSGSAGSYSYSPIAGRELMPVNYVSFWDSLRFANWLHNGRGNSGVFLAHTSDGGYELQVLDSYRNETYVNGMAGSIYKQSIPLVNASLPPGQWQTYDVVWTAPRFRADASLESPARVTALLNGVLVQNDFELRGVTMYIGQPQYHAHGASPILLQAHGDPSPPISYRNIWVRPLN